MGEPQALLPPFKVHCMVGLRCKLGGEGSWECWRGQRSGPMTPASPPRKTQWAGREAPGPQLGLILRAGGGPRPELQAAEQEPRPGWVPSHPSVQLLGVCRAVGQGGQAPHSWTSQISDSKGGSFLSWSRRAKTCSE